MIAPKNISRFAIYFVPPESNDLTRFTASWFGWDVYKGIKVDYPVLHNLNYDIEVDGGINFSNSRDVINAGANILVSGTTIFSENNGDIKKNIETLKSV